MRSSFFMAVALLCGASSASWADEPTPTSPTSPASATPAQPGNAAPASATSTLSAAAPATAEAPSAKPGSGKDPGTEQQKRMMLARGYKQETRDGVTRYCRMEGSLGTRFETKHCATAEEMDAATQNGQDFYNSIKNYGIPKGKN
jgi:hypothetical protein